MRSSSKKAYLVAIVTLIVDQLSKFWAEQLNLVKLNGVGTLGLFNFKFASTGLVNLVLIFAVVIILTWLINWWKASLKNEKFYILIILSAGFSNLLDRILYGGVRDWLELPFFAIKNNLADVVIFIALMGWLVAVYNSRKKV